MSTAALTNEHLNAQTSTPEPAGRSNGEPRRGDVEWLRLVRAEYLEVPGLSLTKPQIQRMWGLDAAQCDALLDVLTTARFLRRTHAGAYVRADLGDR